jgi:hypothetical protein
MSELLLGLLCGLSLLLGLLLGLLLLGLLLLLEPLLGWWWSPPLRGSLRPPLLHLLLGGLLLRAPAWLLGLLRRLLLRAPLLGLLRGSTGLLLSSPAWRALKCVCLRGIPVISWWVVLLNNPWSHIKCQRRGPEVRHSFFVQEAVREIGEGLLGQGKLTNIFGADGVPCFQGGSYHCDEDWFSHF